MGIKVKNAKIIFGKRGEVFEVKHVRVTLSIEKELIPFSLEL